jgi:large subunit ribosomal protein L7Ae
MPGKTQNNAKPATKKAAAPYKKAETAAPVKADAPATNPLFQARPKNFGIGRDVPYKRDISRFMRWPVFVTRQRKRRVLERRLKVPPALNQFRKTVDRVTRNELLKLVKKYRPESRKERRARIKTEAEAKAKDGKKTTATKRPVSVVSGIQEVTRAIERKHARLVIISSNVEPAELTLWMPTLCRTNSIPYVIIKDKARLGEAIGQKTATAVAFTDIKSDDEGALKNLIKSVNSRFLARGEWLRRQWGGLQSSLRSIAALRKKRARAQANAAVAEE